MSENILVDTIWGIDGSPYIIENPILVDSGATLTIDPGVVIKFRTENSSYFYVLGKIIANGTADNLIYFTSIYDDAVGGSTDDEEFCYDDLDEDGNFIKEICEDFDLGDPYSNDWGGIYFNSSSGSIFKNTYFKYTDTALSFESSSGDIENINIDDSISGISLYKDSNVNISNIDLNNIEKDAFLIFQNSRLNINNGDVVNTKEGLTLYNNSSFVANNLDVSCSDVGVTAYQNSSVDISGGSISCLKDGLLFFNEVKANISSLKIENAEDAGVLVYNNINSDIKFTNNEIINNNYGFVVFNSPIFVNQNSIHDNIIKGALTFPVINQNTGETIYQDLDFTSNYWGDKTGPTHSSNVSGLGDTISDHILYNPFLLTDPLIKTGPSNILFLPGFEGSRLYKSESGDEIKIWEPNGNDEQLKNLLMDSNGDTTRDDIYTKDVIDYAYHLRKNGGIYRSFLDQLDSMKNEDYIINDYSVAPYDWRLSIYDIVNSGHQYDTGEIYYAGIFGQTTDPYIVKELRRLASTSKSGKVTIVAHSNGGLVTKALTGKLGSEASQLIDKIIFVGVPQIGTPKSIGGLLHGFDSALPSSLFSFMGVSDSELREIGQNMPSAYNLLPSSQYFTNIDDPVVTFDDSNLLAPWREKYGSVIHSTETLSNFLTDTLRTTMPTSKDLYSPTILNKILFDKSKIMHEDVDIWTPPEGVDLIEIAGWGIDTLKTIEYYQGVKSNCILPVNFAFCHTSPVLEYRPVTTLDGDKTVVTPSAVWIPESDNVKRYWLDLEGYNKPLLTIDRNHASILEVSPLRNFIQNIITNNMDSLPEFISTSAPQDTGESRLHFILHSPLSIDLYDDEGNHTGVSSIDSTLEENIPGSNYQTFGEVKYISVPASTGLHLSMKGYEEGSFSLDIEEVKDGTVVNNVTFAGIPTSVNTIATIDVPENGGVADISPLSVDIDNNGDVDIVLDSKLGEVVTPDFNPPEPKISIDVVTKDLKIESNEPDTIISKNSNTYTLTDKSGNTTKLFFKKTFIGKLLTHTKLTGVQYNDEKIVNLPDSSFIYVWGINKNSPKLLSQTIIVSHNYIIEAVYDVKKDKTTVFLKKKGIIVSKQVFTGLHTPKLFLDKGVVGYEL